MRHIPHRPKRIGIAVSASDMASAMRLLRGVARYARPDMPWLFLFQYEARGAGVEWLEQGDFDGIIMRCYSRELLDAAAQLKIPVVDYSMEQWAVDTPLASVGVDNHAIGRKAAEHLLDRGFEHFAYAAGTTHMSQQRQEGFIERLAQAGRTASVLNVAAPRGEFWPTYDPRLDDEVCRWLTDLPRPLGVMAYRDPAGVVVLRACQCLELRVPDQVAVVGVNDDEALCDLAYPPLSSVRTPIEKIGYECAALLHRLFEGEQLSSERVVLQPLEVHVRQSSDIFAVNDPDLRRALMWIQQHAGDNVEVGQLLADLGLDRRALERKCRKALGRTPAEQIRNVHLERAKRLLLDTDLPMPDVAVRSGFANATRLAETFRRELNTTPTRYRKSR